MGEAFFASEVNLTSQEKYGHYRGAKISAVLPVLQAIAEGKRDVWSWDRNPQCKYLRFDIDTRDGGYVRIYDRDDNLVSVEEVEFQPGLSPPTEGAE